MSSTKLSILAGYAVLIAIVIAAAGSTAANYALGLLLILAAAHLVEMLVFYKRCQQAGGSMATHMLHVFLFGVFHIRELNSQA